MFNDSVLLYMKEIFTIPTSCDMVEHQHKKNYDEIFINIYI